MALKKKYKKPLEFRNAQKLWFELKLTAVSPDTKTWRHMLVYLVFRFAEEEMLVRRGKSQIVSSTSRDFEPTTMFSISSLDILKIRSTTRSWIQTKTKMPSSRMSRFRFLSRLSYVSRSMEIFSMIKGLVDFIIEDMLFHPDDIDSFSKTCALNLYKICDWIGNYLN